MAEALAPIVGMRHAIDVEARSAGTLGLVGKPCPRQLVAVAREVGIDLTRHRSQGVTQALLDWADDVLVMEAAHAEWLAKEMPGLDLEKVVQLGPLVGRSQIDDPHGAWFKGPYRSMREEVGTALERFLGGLARGRRS